MKRLYVLAIAAFAACGVSGGATNPGETHSGDSALNIQSGENTKAEQNKIAYLQRISGVLARYDRDLVALKTQRNQMTPGTSAYRSVDLRVEAMNSRLAEIRRDIAMIQSDDSAHWRVEKANIDENLADLSRISKGLAE